MKLQLKYGQERKNKRRQIIMRRIERKRIKGGRGGGVKALQPSCDL